MPQCRRDSYGAPHTKSKELAAHSGALDENKNSTWSDLLDPIRHSRTRATDAGHRPIAKVNDAPDALEEHDALRTLEVHDAPSALEVLDVSIAPEVNGTPCTFKVHTAPSAFEVGMAPLILNNGDALSALETRTVYQASLRCTQRHQITRCANRL